jgi:hypothetical protein
MCGDRNEETRSLVRRREEYGDVEKLRDETERRVERLLRLEIGN